MQCIPVMSSMGLWCHLLCTFFFLRQCVHPVKMSTINQRNYWFAFPLPVWKLYCGSDETEMHDLHLWQQALKRTSASLSLQYLNKSAVGSWGVHWLWQVRGKKNTVQAENAKWGQWACQWRRRVQGYVLTCHSSSTEHSRFLSWLLGGGVRAEAWDPLLIGEK